MDEAGVTDVESLADRLGNKISIPGREREFVELSLRSSNLRTLALDASYIIYPAADGSVGGGIPLDVKVNPTLNYSQFFVKADSAIRGYNKIDRDVFGNHIQELSVEPAEWRVVRVVVKELSNGR